MKNTKLMFASIAFIGAISTAFATKPLSQRDLWMKSGSGGSTVCELISCSQTNRGVGVCATTGTKYVNSECADVYHGTAYAVQFP